MAKKAEDKPGPKEILGDTLDKTKASLEDAKEKVKSASRVVHEQSVKASEYARDRYGVASESLRDGYGRARKDLDKLQQDVTTYVQDNPGRAVLIAAAAGFFIGFLIRADRRR